MSEAACSADNQLLSFHTRLGVFVAFEAALISAVSVFILLCYTAYRVTRKMWAHYATRRTNIQHELLPIDATDSLGFIVLMFWELIKALGGMLNLRWALQGRITVDSLCTTQGYLAQIGDIGVALSSLFIGFDTFFVLVFGWRAPSRVNIGAIIGLNLFVVVLVAIGGGINNGKNPPYIGDTGYWCWIQKNYLPDQIALEYLWMWVAALIQIILYVIMALVMRGFLVVEGRLLRPRAGNDVLIKMESQESDSNSDASENRIIANLMFLYPAIYIVCVLPVSIVRWTYFTRDAQPPASALATSCVFGLSGLFNVLFYTFTRPDLVSGQTLEIPSASPTPVNHTASPGREEEPFRRRALQGRLPEDDEPMGLNPLSAGMGLISPTR